MGQMIWMVELDKSCQSKSYYKVKRAKLAFCKFELRRKVHFSIESGLIVSNLNLDVFN